MLCGDVAIGFLFGNLVKEMLEILKITRKWRYLFWGFHLGYGWLGFRGLFSIFLLIGEQGTVCRLDFI